MGSKADALGAATKKYSHGSGSVEANPVKNTNVPSVVDSQNKATDVRKIDSHTNNANNTSSNSAIDTTGVNSISSTKTKLWTMKAGFYIRPELNAKFKDIAYDRRMSMNQLLDEVLTAFCKHYDEQKAINGSHS